MQLEVESNKPGEGNLQTIPSPGFVSGRTPLLLAAWTFGFAFLTLGYFAATEPLWVDEIFTLVNSSKPAREIVRDHYNYKQFLHDHPPLYFLLMRLVLLIGDSPLLLRLPSLLCMTVAAAFWVVRVWREGLPPWLAALVACLLLSQPTLAYQATNFRMYAFITLIGTGGILLSDRLLRAAGGQQIRLAIALTLLLAALFYTSYFGVIFGFFVGCLGLIAAASPRLFASRSRRPGLLLSAGALLALLLFTPWMPVIGNMIETESTSTDPVPLAKGLQIIELFHNFGGTWTGLVFMILGWIALGCSPAPRRFWFVGLIVFVLAPLMLVILASPERRVVSVRYVIYAIPFVLTGATLGFYRLATRITQTGRGVALTCALFVTLGAHFCFDNMTHLFKPLPDWWAAAEIIETNAVPGETIMTSAYLSGDSLAYHLDHPENYNILYYVLQLDDFYKTAADPQVMWHITAGIPEPELYLRVVQRYFPYRVTIEGNRGIIDTNSWIYIRSKRPFNLHDGTPAPRYDLIPLTEAEARDWATHNNEPTQKD